MALSYLAQKQAALPRSTSALGGRGRESIERVWGQPGASLTNRTNTMHQADSILETLGAFSGVVLAFVVFWTIFLGVCLWDLVAMITRRKS